VKAILLGVRLGWSRQVAHRWRQLSVVGAVVLTVVVVLFSLGFAGASGAAQQRAVDRAPVLDVDAGAVAALHLRMGAEIYQDRQFPVVWFEPGTGAPVPPGLTRWPEPGTVAVSPAIASAPRVVKALGFVVSDAGTGPGGAIGPEGVVADSEWLVYAVPGPGRTLGESESLVAVTGFGPRAAATPAETYETDPAMPSAALAVFGCAWLLVLPVLVLLGLGSRAYSPLVRRRELTLGRLGLTPGQVRRVSVVEVASLALPAAALGALVWQVAAPHLAVIPVTGLRLVPHALVLPWWLAILVALVLGVLAAVVGALPGRGNDGRHVRGGTRVRWYTVVPLVLALAGMVGSHAIGRPAAVPVLLGALLLTTAALPLALPWLVQWQGARIARIGRPHTWLAGRRLAFSPAALSRPAVAVGVLMFVAGAGTGFFLQQPTLAPHDGGLGVYDTSWRAPVDGDVEAVQAKLPDAAVGVQAGVGGLRFLSCEHLAQALGPGTDCADPDDVLRTLWQAAHLVGSFDPVPAVRTGDHERAAVVVGQGTTIEDVERAVRGLPAAASSPRGPFQLAPTLRYAWLGGAMLTALGLLLLAALHSFGNRALRSAREDAEMLKLGLDVSQVRSVQRWALAAPLLTFVPLAGGTALVFVWAGNDTDLVATAVGPILLETAVVLLACAAAIALIDRLQSRIG